MSPTTLPRSSSPLSGGGGGGAGGAGRADYSSGHYDDDE